MARWILFFALAVGAMAYTFWLYLRVELRVRRSHLLATLRAVSLVVILALLFDFRLPLLWGDGARSEWVLLDASLSMIATNPGGESAWEVAEGRARELEREGWTVVAFGANTESLDEIGVGQPTAASTLLAPVLGQAVESGVDRVRVLSDFRFQDPVAVSAALASLPLEVEFERFGEGVSNAGVSRLEVPDLVRAEGSVTAELEVHGGNPGDSITVIISEEDSEVAEVRVVAPSPGFRSRLPIALPTPSETGRVRYQATVALESDGFPSDDTAVSYASVGYEEEALVLISLQADWEPRFLLPVMEEVTGLPGLGYLRVGPDSFVPMGRAVERGLPVDSASVGLAASSAAVLVLHGLGSNADEWVRNLSVRPGRNVLLVVDAEGAELAGVPTGDPRDGEWYVSQEIPASPIAGSLVGVDVQGLPPLTDVLLPTDPTQVRGSLLTQLRGTGPLEAALHLDDRAEGRVAVTLSSGFWRWAARQSGREAYRRLWSGVAGWLLAGQALTNGEVRPTQWTVERDQPVIWSVPDDGVEPRIIISSADSIVVDTIVTSNGLVSTGVLPPGQYSYRIEHDLEELLVEGRFDVAASTLEMVTAPEQPQIVSSDSTSDSGSEEGGSRPLRTQPWPYLLVITLLCAEWVGRRRSGLR
tara:strand:- start:113958 stop:115892 length:1935 start_codon:yes stop_codon:yes gene_type:complete